MHRTPEPRDREIDDAVVHGRDVVVRQAEPLGGAGPEVLGHDVEAGGQAQDEVTSRPAA